MNEGLMDIKDLCVYLKLGKTNAYKLVKNGMPHIRIGRQIRFRVSDVNRWIEGKRIDKGGVVAE